MESFLLRIFVFFVAAAITVPLARKAGIGAVSGYLVAGILIGPGCLALAGDVESVMHFSEFGVVMMLFIIGLEMKPALLWAMRGRIVGLGGGQLALTTGLLTAAGLAFLPWQQALVLGLILSLSAAAIVLQLMKERGHSDSDAGRAVLAVLLLHDLAVVPLLAVLPLLATGPALGGGHEEALLDLHHFSSRVRVLLTLAAITAIFLTGRYATRPIFRMAAKTGMRELLTAASLALVVGSALLVMAVGLPAPLGTFLAGVVLAESEYRHELESNIEPFKGLLLGFFFIAIGASLDLKFLAENWQLITLLVAALIGIKWVGLYLASLVTAIKEKSWFATSLAQGGTFAFILLPFALETGVIDHQLYNLTLSVVVLSMFLAPFLIILQERFSAPQGAEKLEQTGEHGRRVVLAGFGRLGTDLGRLLLSAGIQPVILDHDPDNVKTLRRFGFEVYYGDITRLDLLQAAGAAEAEMLVITISNQEKIKSLIHLARQYFPRLQIAVAAADWEARYQLMELGVEILCRETEGSAVALATDCLQLLGCSPYRAGRLASAFRFQEQKALPQLFQTWQQEDRSSFFSSVKEFNSNLTRLLTTGGAENLEAAGRAWAKPGTEGREVGSDRPKEQP